MADHARWPAGRRQVGSAGLVAAALLAPALLATSPATADAGTPAGTYIVRAMPGSLPQVVDDLGAVGVVSRRIELINSAVVRLPAGAASAVRRNPQVESITADGTVQLRTTATTRTTGGYDARGDVNSMYNIERLIGARNLWRAGYTGRGIDVALLDSGVAPVRGLGAAGQVVHGPDLTPESQNVRTRHLDTFGHGTHMAGIIAGRDPWTNPAASAEDSAPFLGVAPRARIVSVKVADARGATDVSQVLAGIDWIVQHARDPGFNIRVLNLSFGTDSAQSYLYDPLAFAAEQAWRRGIVVVVSAGNSGFADGRLTNPAMNPNLLAVGADDTRGTWLITDDTIPSFSSRGDLLRNPDLVAPGVHVQSLRVPGSYIDATYGATGKIDTRFFRGSGTSQAAAVTSGAIALLLQQRPGLTPDQVKYVLQATADNLLVADPRAQGRGLLDLRFAGSVPLPLGLTLASPGTGTGSLDASRGTARLALDGVALRGERDIFGKPFSSVAMARAEAAAASWIGGTWNANTWAGAGWSGDAWSSVRWTGRTWAGGTWSGRTWASGTWDGRTWAGTNWTGRTWAGFGWAGRTWAGRTWADDDWS